MVYRISSVKIHNASDFGKVAVLMGGQSAEREISLISGDAVYQALIRRGVDAHAIDAGAGVMQKIAAGNFNRAFIIMHGRGGEDGVIQGALETTGIPYTGSGVLGSALAMDKLRTKQLWMSAGLATPPFVLLDGGDMSATVEMGMPLIVKPVNEGSSLGMTKVETKEALAAAWKTASEFDSQVFAEQWITGKEYTAAILNGEVLPLIRIKTARQFYDYEAKYQSNDTKYICPCGLDGGQENKIKKLALKAFESIGCQGWGRVDILCDEQGDPWLIEVNTVPGMTDHSLVPMAARAAGIEFDDLVWRILETSFRTDKQFMEAGNKQGIVSNG